MIPWWSAVVAFLTGVAVAVIVFMWFLGRVYQHELAKRRAHASLN